MPETILELISDPRVLVTGIMGIIVITLILPMYKRGKQTQNKKKRMRKKTKAQVTDIDRRLMTRENGEVWVKYVFTVDGKEYTGSGTYLLGEYQLFKKVKVYYNPDDPSENRTSLMWINMGTAGAKLWFSVIAAIVILTFLFT